MPACSRGAFFALVLAGGSLASLLFRGSAIRSIPGGFRVERRKGSGVCAYQLVQIPSADAHVAAVLVHALGELLRRAGAVVAPAAVLLGRGGRLDGLGRGAGTAEEPADGVADGGPYRDTAVVACR